MGWTVGTKHLQRELCESSGLSRVMQKLQHLGQACAQVEEGRRTEVTRCRPTPLRMCHSPQCNLL